MAENAPQTDEQKQRRWQNTRRMAWMAFIAAATYPLAVYLGDSQQLTEIAWPFYLFMGSVVGVYVGFSTAEGKWSKR